jgi:hypothetical protein
LPQVPCIEIDDKTPEEIEILEKCQNYMNYRAGRSSHMESAMEAAIDAWKIAMAKKDKEKDMFEKRKLQVEQMQLEGLTDTEIFEVLCTAGGPCDIFGEYPLQAACRDPDEPMGCPCPDLQCPKRASFDYQMIGPDMSQYKSELAS